MARKKQEIQLQREIETQEEWEEVMAMEGLWVVDVYQEWCGPCQALVANFRRLKNELGDSLLNFAIAKADTIDALEKYRGRCEPTFLFYAGGILTSYIHGANAPKVQRVITEQLASEHKILEGTGERKEVKDPVITRMQEIENERLAEEEAQKAAEEAKGVTVAIIKPDAVAQGKTEEIMNEMKENGIEIIAEEERELTDEEARELYSHLHDEPFFEELIKFITSGPSHVLVITKGATGDSIVKDWREMIGPTDVEQAKEEAPNSLRAKYGEKGYMNALHGSSSKDTAAKELAFFFPNLSVPTYKKKKENIQRTLALIRPEAFSAKKDEILQKISEAGFKIAMYKEIQLSKEQAAEFYKEHEQYAYFDSLVENMSSGPVLALGLARDEAIQAWRDMLGPSNVDDALEKAPNSLRAQFTGPSGMNQLHGSDTEEAAKKELKYFFPMEQTVAVIKPSGMDNKEEIIQKIHEAGFRVAAQQEQTITPEIAEILYPDHADKEYYEDLIGSMTSGPTLFMVLSREDAVQGWRRELGPTDPDEARNNNPESFRAQFGRDILNNALHGSSNPDHAKNQIKAIFGDLKFNSDGTLRGEQPDLDEAAAVIEHDRAAEAADIAPEYRKAQDTTEETSAGDTTADQTSVEPDTTQDVTAQDATADDTQADVTADTTQDADTTQMTADDTTVADTTVADTTVADTTTVGDTTTAPGGETTTGEETTAGDTTAGDTTQADTTTDQTTTADQTTTNQTSESEKTPGSEENKEEKKEEEKKEEPAAGATTEAASSSQEAKEASPAASEQQTTQEADTTGQKAEDKPQAEAEQKPASPEVAPPKEGESTQKKDETAPGEAESGTTANAEGEETTEAEG